jgi:hypothetical protein
MLFVSSLYVIWTYPKIIRLVVWEDDDDLVFLPKSSNELGNVSTAPDYQLD